MCFSATASFTVSAVLTAVGGLALAGSGGALAGSDRRTTHMLAAIPLLFAAQQAAEGIVWLTLGPDHPPVLHLAATDLFLAFALAVWPTWFPLACLIAEPDPARRRLQRLLVWLGVAVSTLGAGAIVYCQPRAMVQDHSIHYDFGMPVGPLQLVYLGIYALPIVAPFLISSLPLAPLVGVALLVGLIATFVVKLTALTSVWCFFAAMSSALLALGLQRARRTP